MPPFDGSSLPEVFAAQVLLWVLLPIALFAPARWAVFAWLVMGNLDATGSGQAISDTGLLNAVKSLIIPLWLLWRLRHAPGSIHRTLPGRVWMALILYASALTLWSPFPVASYKLVGNMVGIMLAFLVLEKAARSGLLNARLLLTLISTSLALALIQTYVYGGASYGFDGLDQPSRLSSFISAQQFAAFLVAFLALILWRPEFRTTTRLLMGSGIVLALALNGSRVWFFGAVIISIVFLFFSYGRAAIISSLVGLTTVSAVLLALSLTSPDALAFDESSNRIVATVNALATGVDTSSRVGLRDLSFRTAIYAGLLNDIGSSPVSEILLGHGTSSGATGVLRVYPNSYDLEHLDPNRIVHNEWLRALYEWGIVGLLLLATAFGSMTAGLVTAFRASRTNPNIMAALSFLPAFLLAFSGENVLAGAGNAVTMSLALMTCLRWAPHAKARLNGEGESVSA